MNNLNKDYYIRHVMKYIQSKGSDGLLTLNVIYNIGCQSFIEIVGHVVDDNALTAQVESLFDPDIIISFYDKHEQLILDHFKKQMNIEGKYSTLKDYLSNITFFKSYMMCDEFFESVLSKDKESYNAIRMFNEVAYWYLLEEICIDFNKYCTDNNVNIKVIKHDFEQYSVFY